VAFYPHWGKNRMQSMLETRPDWCLSRQRVWGLPIPAFYPPPGEAGQPLLTEQSVRAVAQLIGEKGSDVWFQAEPHDLLQYYEVENDPDAPQWAKAAVGDRQSAIGKSMDIFDVWFESGSSWNAALKRRFEDQYGEKTYPADLYLEGSDQHRGWFQLSLLPAVAVTGQSPFKGLLTHGFMVDKHGRKMSKSLGNTLEVEDLLKTYGADVCRWWCASLAYADDVKVDEDFFKEAGEAYRKVRNTIRFMLSNLSDFDPPRDAYAFSDADAASLDAWALAQLDELTTTVQRAFEQYEFRRAHQALFDFCNDTLSATYLAAVKDRLYCDQPDEPRRRRTQTALQTLADHLIRLLGPFLPHTAEEAWRVLHGEEAASVHLQQFPGHVAVASRAEWATVMAQRDQWLKRIEDDRQQRELDNPLDLGLMLPEGEATQASFDRRDFADLCGISQFDFAAGQTKVVDLRNEPRCDRCWKRTGDVLQRDDGIGGMLCERCHNAVQAVS
jgi:isoleucyl-tRNA synthetase